MLRDKAQSCHTVNSCTSEVEPAAAESLLKYLDPKRQNAQLKRIRLATKPIPEPNYSYERL